MLSLPAASQGPEITEIVDWKHKELGPGQHGVRGVETMGRELQKRLTKGRNGNAKKRGRGGA